MRSQAPTAGRALLVLRTYRAITQARLAEISGVSRAAISDFERSEREPGPETLQRLVGALGLPVRAWDDTVRHVDWLDWLGGRTGPRGPDIDRAVAHVAASAGRDLERHLCAVLGLLRSPRRGEARP